MPLAVKFTDVSRYFGDVRAVDAVNFDVQTGEFFSLLGPSGSGKTTCLRMLAGFEHPTSGIIELYGRDVTNLPPYEREVNTVFQNYALFPHMSVEDNIGYGLMVKGVNKTERARRVAEILALVHLPGMEKRKPSQLSGGQQQRVALARALINRPRVLLLDEPLGALDLKLRQQMQIELKAIQREVGITFIFVTHDQEEALTMSNRIAVFNMGQIEQIGTPAELYEHPATPFVATFVGISNLLSAEQAAPITGVKHAVSVRPEKIHFAELAAPVPAGYCSTTGTIGEIIYLGMYTRYSVNLDGGGELQVVEQNRTVTSKDILAAEGRRVQLLWPAAANNPL